MFPMHLHVHLGTVQRDRAQVRHRPSHGSREEKLPQGSLIIYLHDSHGDHQPLSSVQHLQDRPGSHPHSARLELLPQTHLQNPLPVQGLPGPHCFKVAFHPGLLGEERAMQGCGQHSLLPLQSWLEVLGGPWCPNSAAVLGDTPVCFQARAQTRTHIHGYSPGSRNGVSFGE